MANWALLQEQLVDKPVYKRAKHGIHFKNSDGSILANFSGKPCHYLDGGIYKPIDTKLIAIGTEYGAPGLKPRITKSGLVRIDGTNYSQQSTRIGIFNPTTKKFTAIKTIPLGSLDEDKLVAESGVWRRELRLTEDGLKEEIIIASKPTNTGATLQDWLVLETAVSWISVPDGWLNDYEVGEFKFPPPTAHDAEGNEADCKRYARNVNGVQYIYTGVSAVWLNSAVYPVVIDPDFASGGSDWRIEGLENTYVAARSTSREALHTTMVAGQRTGYSVYRGYVKFGTSSIGANIIAQVNLKLTVAADVSDTDFDVQIAKYNWSAFAADTGAAQREIAYDGALAADLDSAIWRNTNGISANTGYTSGNLSTSWVSKDGVTYYALRSKKDSDNTAPIGNEYITLYGGQEATAGYRPVLAVTYTAAGIFIPINFAAGMQSLSGGMRG